MRTLVLSVGILVGGPALAGLTGKVCKSGPASPHFPVAQCQLPDCPPGQDCAEPQVDKGSIRFGEPYFTWRADCRPHTGVGCWDGKFPVSVRVKASDQTSLKEVGVRLRGMKDGVPFSRTVYGAATLADSAGFYRFEHHVAEWVPVDGNVSFSVERFCARDQAGNEACVLPRSDLTPGELSGSAPENMRGEFAPPAQHPRGE